MKREFTLIVRLSEQEAKDLKAKAEAQGLTMSALVRELIRKQKMTIGKAFTYGIRH